MTNEKLIPIIISGCAFVVSVVVAFITTKRTKRFNTSDFKLSQKVKDETLELLAVLRALQLKALNSTQGYTDITITKEKDKINAFLHSSTAFAYYVWVGKRSKDSGKDPEDWRVFFLELSQILNIDDVYSAGCLAADLEVFFDTLTENDFIQITSYLENVPKGLSKFKNSRQYDTAIKAFVDLSYERKIERELFPRKLKHLKNKGIIDPNIDLFLAVSLKDTELVKNALEKGADPTMTDTQLINQYKKELSDFEL